MLNYLRCFASFPKFLHYQALRFAPGGRQSAAAEAARGGPAGAAPAALGARPSPPCALPGPGGTPPSPPAPEAGSPGGGERAVPGPTAARRPGAGSGGCLAGPGRAQPPLPGLPAAPPGLGCSPGQARGPRVAGTGRGAVAPLAPSGPGARLRSRAGGRGCWGGRWGRIPRPGPALSRAGTRSEPPASPRPPQLALNARPSPACPSL